MFSGTHELGSFAWNENFQNRQKIASELGKIKYFFSTLQFLNILLPFLENSSFWHLLMAYYVRKSRYFFYRNSPPPQKKTRGKKECLFPFGLSVTCMHNPCTSICTSLRSIKHLTPLAYSTTDNIETNFFSD